VIRIEHGLRAVLDGERGRNVYASRILDIFGAQTKSDANLFAPPGRKFA
jgi:hypothetical protein